MTEAPNTARVFELIHLFNEGVQNQESPDDLLKRALPAIVACVPGGQAARVYQIKQDILSLWAGDAPPSLTDDAPISINTHPAYAHVLRTLSPAYDADSSRVAFPLQRGTQVFGLVEVDTQERNIDLLPLHAVMNHIAVALDNLRLRDLLHQQDRTAHELANCTSMAEIAAAFARNLLQQGQYVAINVFHYDADGAFAGFKTVAAANRHQTFDVQDLINLTLDEFGWPLNRIYDPGIPVLVADVQNESTIHEHFRAWLQQRNAASFYGIPMWARGEVIGFIALASTHFIVDLTQAEMQMYRTLADQIGALVYTQQAIKDSGIASQQNQEVAKHTEQLAAQIVATNREISLAETQSEMAQAILRAMPEFIDSVLISTFNRPVTAGEVPDAIVLDVIVQSDQTIEAGIVDEPKTDDPTLKNVIAQLIEGEIFHIPDIASYQAIMTPHALRAMHENGIRSTATLGLRSGQNLLGMLIFGSSQSAQLLEQLQGTVRALADQFATTMENRNLFNQTAETLGFVHAQYETITQIHNAADSVQLLEAIYDFVGETYSAAFLARIAYPSQPMQAQILAQIDQNGSKPTNRYVFMSDFKWVEGLLALRETRIRAIATEPDIDEPIRQQLQAAGVQSVLNIPLVVNERLVGFVHFTHHEPASVTDEQMRALGGLANQIAIVLENEDLLKQTEESLAETSALYDVNRSLLEAQGMLDILSAIFRFIAPNSASIAYLEIRYDDDLAIETLQINHMVTPAGATTVENPLQFPIDSATGTRLAEHWASLGHQLEMLEDIRKDADHPLAALPLLQGVGSLIIIPVLKQDVRVGQIHIVYDKARAFDTRTQRLCQAVRNQIVIVQQNNDLLRDTQITANQLREQVRVQETLNKLATSLNSMHDEYTLLSEACKTLVTALDIDHAGMTLIDEDGLIATVTGEFPDNGTVGLEIEATGQIWDILRQSPDSFVINNVDNNPLLEPMSRQALQSIGVKSVLFLPLNDQNGTLIGSVGLDILTTDKVFDKSMTDLAQTITLQIALGVQNIRLLREAQASASELANRVQNLQSLNEAVSVLNALRNEPELRREAGQVLVESVGVDHVGIAMIDSDGKHVTVVNEFPEQGLVGLRINLGSDELQARLMKTLRPIVINNLPESHEMSLENRKTLVNAGIHSLMVFPLVDVNNRFIGSIGLDIFDEGREFDTEMISIANTLVTQITVSIQNIRLLESARKQATQLQQITAFSQSMQATLDVNEIFRTAIEISRRVMPIDHMSIILYDTEKASLQIVARFSEQGLQIDVEAPTAIPKSEGSLIKRAWEARSMLHYDNLADHEDAQHPFEKHLRSALFLPLFSRGLMRGIIEISTRMASAYTETDITVFRQMVNQLAVALENAEAYTQSQQIAKNRALVNEISGRLQQQISLDSVLDVTVREVGKALGARRGRIRLGLRSENGEPSTTEPEE